MTQPNTHAPPPEERAPRCTCGMGPLSFVEHDTDCPVWKIGNDKANAEIDAAYPPPPADATAGELVALRERFRDLMAGILNADSPAEEAARWAVFDAAVTDLAAPCAECARLREDVELLRHIALEYAVEARYIESRKHGKSWLYRLGYTDSWFDTREGALAEYIRRAALRAPSTQREE